MIQLIVRMTIDGRNHWLYVTKTTKLHNENFPFISCSLSLLLMVGA